MVIQFDKNESKSKTVLLVSSYAPHTFGGSSFMLYQLVEQWLPHFKIFVLTSSKNIGVLMKDPLPVPTWYYDFPPQLLRAREREQKLLQPGQRRGDFFNLLKSHLPVRSQKISNMIIGPFRFLKELRALIRKGIEILSQEDVDKILISSDRGIAFWGGFFLSLRFQKPYSLLMFDLYKGNYFYPFEAIMAFSLEGLLFKRAEHIFVAGEGMLEYYKKRYSRPFTLVANSVNLKDFPPASPPVVVGYPFTILYSGTIYWAQANALKTLVEAIREDRDYRLCLYSPHSEEIIKKRGLLGPNVELGLLPREKLLNVQRSADVLFLPMSFNRRYRLVVETAPTSKLYEYMASFRPILILAPPYSFVARYAQKHRLAMVVTEKDPKAVKEALESLRKDAALRQELVENSWRIVQQNHDIRRNASIIEEVLWR